MVGGHPPHPTTLLHRRPECGAVAGSVPPRWCPERSSCCGAR